MARTRSQSQQHKAISRKRNQEPMGIDEEVCSSKRRHSSDNGGANVLSDDVLVNILSRLSLKEAGRASVISRRWRFLWMFAYGTLHFGSTNSNRDVIERKKLECWVNTVVELHQAHYIERTAICFGTGGEDKCAVDSWVNFAMQKGVERFELNLSFDSFEFPSVERLMSHSHSHRLRSLRLDHVDVMDDVVHCFLASCPNLEELCIHFSQVTMNLQVIDPPRLRVLEVHRCLKMQRLEISAVNLISLTYGGGKKSLKLKKVPNLRGLTISHDFCVSFVIEPEDHSSYSVQLEKLVLDFQLMNHRRIIVAPPVLPRLCSLKRLEVQVFTRAGGTNLRYLPTLIKACPQLCVFRVEMFHSPHPTRIEPDKLPFPIRPPSSKAEKCVGSTSRITLVEIAGYIGCLTDDNLVLGLLKSGGRSIKRVVIDTRSAYYDDPLLDRHMAGIRLVQIITENRVREDAGATTRNEAIKRAKTLASKFPRRIKYVIT